MPDIEIPDHWNWKRLDEIGEWNTGGTPRRSTEEYWKDGTIPWVTPKEMKRPRISSTGDNMTELGLEESTAKLVPEGTVLFVTRSGILEHSLPVAVAEVELTVNQDMKTLTPHEGINSEFILYYAQAVENEILRECTKDGTTVASIDSDSLYSYKIPIPPENEQNDIVQKLNELFTIIDNATSGLTISKEKIQRYESSVLHASFDGSLTSDWRTTHAEELEAVQVPGIENTESLTDPEDLPDIPSSWRWATFEQVSERVTVGHVGSMKDRYTSEGIPFLRGKNVRANRFDPDDLKYIPRSFHEELNKSKLEPGDLVVVRSGDVGVSCVIPDTLEEANCSDLVIVKQPDLINANLASYYMNSVAKSSVASEKVGVAQEHFNTKSMAKMPVPIPSRKEQNQLLEKIDQRISVIGEVKDAVEKNLDRSQKLKSSILKRAFKGSLIDTSKKDTQKSENSLSDSTSTQVTLGEVSEEVTINDN
jgi:type I restriction enzyme S subunit